MSDLEDNKRVCRACRSPQRSERPSHRTCIAGARVTCVTLHVILRHSAVQIHTSPTHLSPVGLNSPSLTKAQVPRAPFRPRLGNSVPARDGSQIRFQLAQLLSCCGCIDLDIHKRFGLVTVQHRPRIRVQRSEIVADPLQLFPRYPLICHSFSIQAESRCQLVRCSFRALPCGELRWATFRQVLLRHLQLAITQCGHTAIIYELAKARAIPSSLRAWQWWSHSVRPVLEIVSTASSVDPTSNDVRRPFPRSCPSPACPGASPVHPKPPERKLTPLPWEGELPEDAFAASAAAAAAMAFASGLTPATEAPTEAARTAPPERVEALCGADLAPPPTLPAVIRCAVARARAPCTVLKRSRRRRVTLLRRRTPGPACCDGEQWQSLSQSRIKSAERFSTTISRVAFLASPHRSTLPGSAMLRRLVWRSPTSLVAH